MNTPATYGLINIQFFNNVTHIDIEASMTESEVVEAIVDGVNDDSGAHMIATSQNNTIIFQATHWNSGNCHVNIDPWSHVDPDDDMFSDYLLIMDGPSGYCTG